MKKLILILAFIFCSFTGHCLAFESADFDFSNDGLLGLLAIYTAYTPPMFMLTGAGDPSEIWVSTDPTNPAGWTVSSAQYFQDQGASLVDSLVYHNGYYYAGTDNSPKGFRSSDGQSWSIFTAGLAAAGIDFFLGVGGGRLVAGSNTPDGVIGWSANGEDWFWASDGASTSYSNFVYGPGRFYALKQNSSPAQLTSSVDGSGIWTLAGTSTLTMVGPVYMAYGNSELQILNTGNLGVLGTNNLQTWQATDNPVGFATKAITFVDDGATGRFVAVSSTSPFLTLRTVGDTTWRSPAGSTPTAALHSICYSPTLQLLLVGGAASGDFWYSRDFGETWTALGFSTPKPSQVMNECAVSG